MSVDFWFPTVILNDTIDNQEEINGALLTRIEEIRKEVPSGGRTWLAAPYNTCGTFDISILSISKLLVKQILSLCR